jgi:tRNA 5-methylaminomethyl-2-thiouridine biosynthesis bifunctional protein
VSFIGDASPPGQAAIGGGYLIPTREGLLFGATHDRDEVAAEVRPNDHVRNLDLLAQLRPRLAEALRDQPLAGRAGVRAATPDFLPLAGAVEDAPPGLFILSGLGSRGFCAAPLLAEHLAALALDAPSPLPRALAEIVDPGRFQRRRDRVGRPRA